MKHATPLGGHAKTYSLYDRPTEDGDDDDNGDNGGSGGDGNDAGSRGGEFGIAVLSHPTASHQPRGAQVGDVGWYDSNFRSVCLENASRPARSKPAMGHMKTLVTNAFLFDDGNGAAAVVARGGGSVGAMAGRPATASVSGPTRSLSRASATESTAGDAGTSAVQGTGANHYY